MADYYTLVSFEVRASQWATQKLLELELAGDVS